MTFTGYKFVLFLLASLCWIIFWAAAEDTNTTTNTATTPTTIPTTTTTTPPAKATSTPPITTTTSTTTTTTPPATTTSTLPITTTTTTTTTTTPPTTTTPLISTTPTVTTTTATTSNSSTNTTDYCQSKPCLNDGNCTSNPTNYTCTCQSGLSGVNCQDATYCTPSPCVFGICQASRTNYTCLCQSNFQGRNCTEDVDECNLKNPCTGRLNTECHNTNGSFECHCVSGYGDIDGQCQRATLWPDYNSTYLVKLNGSYPQTIPLQFPIGFPFYNRVYRQINAYFNGFVSLGDGSAMEEPPKYSSWSYSPVFLGVYWADFAQAASSELYVTQDETRFQDLDQTSSLLEFVQTHTNFRALGALSFTWKNMEPKAVSVQSQRATFQLILATDGARSLAIRSYQTVWSKVNQVNWPQLLPTYTWSNGTLVKDTKPESATSEILRFFNQSQSSDELQQCLRNTQTALKSIKDIHQSLPDCPCISKQAEVDYRFVPDTPQSKCYSSRFSYKVSNETFFQYCCYNNNGVLLKNTKDAGIPKNDSSTNLLSNAYQSCCKNDGDTCNWFYTQLPSSNCSTYREATLVAEFGNAHVKTFDSNKYSIQSIGDFVVFKTNGYILQGRTSTQENKTTYFSQYALKVNEPAARIIFKPDKNNPSFLDVNQTTLSGFSLQMIDNYTAAFITKSWTVEVHNDGGVLYHWVYIYSNDFTTTGLMGTFDSNNTNDFLFQNGSTVFGTSDELEVSIINKFVDSWKLNGNDSLLEGSPDNITLTFPVVESSVSKIKKLLNNTEDEAKAKEICGEELFCWQEYALTKTNTSAINIINQIKRLQSRLNRISYTSPMFKEMVKVIRVNSTQVYTLKLELVGNETVDFAVDNVSSFSGIKIENATFTWNISGSLEDLRKRVYPSSLKFTAKDFQNVIAEYRPDIYLCLCGETTQCDFKHIPVEDVTGNPLGNVKSVPCICDEKKNGRYCLDDADICKNCWNASGCNTTLDKYCPACPAGFQGDGFQCLDIDECGTNNGGCQQNCTNNLGSFQCSCFGGYSQNGTVCTDIDECLNQTTCKSDFQLCTNFDGSYKCNCMPGRIGDSCIKAPYSYLGNIVIQNPDGWTNELLNNASAAFINLAKKVSTSITSALNDTLSLNLKNDTEYVQVLSFRIYDTNSTSNSTNFSRRKRDVSHETPILATYIIHLTQSIKINDINEALKNAVQKPDCIKSCSFYNLQSVLQIPSLDSKTDICTILTVNPCDAQTTSCQSTNNQITCACKTGFQKNIYDPFSCVDVNECARNKCGTGQFCTNTFGSYICSCEAGYKWDAASLTCKPDKCKVSPCKNNGICTLSETESGYTCSCTYEWTGNTCEEEDSDARRMKIAVICVSVILGFFCLCLLIILLVVCYKKRKEQSDWTLESDSYTNSRLKDFDGVPRPKVKPNSGRLEMAENGRSNEYESLHTNDNENHSGKHFVNKAYEQDEAVSQERL
ncbi:mucin-like protein [Biomphalaria pfeifferi]|uniref:Mucin-like protein n=1 Tax=Biomphalaria pfeifferi TaxID=112525 RepID=A0AAD8B549_BIOPF|nr:mucin-like protein [Biomphalaria pfeifferi]